MVNDPIADFLTRIRNNIRRQKSEVKIPFNKKVGAIVEILKKEGFILDYKIEGEGIKKELVIKLKYVNGKSAIRDLKRVSKPGVRIYMGYKDIQRVKGGTGIAIFSTPQGIMTGKQAKEQKLGGEYWCQIW